MFHNNTGAVADDPIQTPGSANSIRVINQNTVEFPIDAWVLPYETSDGSELEPIMGGWM